MLSGFGAQSKANKRQKKLARVQVAQLTRAEREEQRLSAIQEAATIGQQRTGYAASGVRVGRGTARLLEEETREEFARSRTLAGLSYSAEKTAAWYGGQTSGVNYASGLGQLAQSVGQVYTSHFQKPAASSGLSGQATVNKAMSQPLPVKQSG
jgi:hypothetical protein